MGGFSDWLTGSVPRRDEYIGGHQAQIDTQINQQLPGLQTRAAAQLDGSQQAQFRGGQQAQIGQLQGIASGQQQGAGELAAQRQVQNALAGQQALARMRGAGGGGMLMAGRNSAGIGLAGAGMGQQAALQDQMGAQGLLTQALGGARGQDIGFANSNAQLQQNQTQLNDQQVLGLMQQMGLMDENELKRRMMLAATTHNGALGGGMMVGGQILGSYMGSK